MEPMVVHYRLTVEAFRMGRAAALSVFQAPTYSSIRLE